MSQVFSADAVANPNAQTLTTTTPLVAITGNFLNPPFGNAKAIVFGNTEIAIGTGTTSLTLILRRNPNAENLQIANLALVSVTAGANVLYSVQGVDAIPDGRPVQYALVVTQNAATGNGQVYSAAVAAVLISG